MNKICTAKKKIEMAGQAGKSPVATHPPSQEKLDAHPIITELLISWKVAGILVFVYDYHSLSSNVSVFPNWIEKLKLKG